jgi:putative membrane protein
MSKQWSVVAVVALGAAVCGFLARWSGIVAPWPVSWMAMVLFALPSFGAAVHWLGPRNGIGSLVSLSLLAISIESLGVATGWPYGAFSYASVLGPKIFGLVPPTVPFGWIPLVLAAWTLAPARRRFLVALTLLIGFDFVFDPAAVALGFWHWDIPGPWFGVPWINFFGWMVSSSVGFAMLRAFACRTPVPAYLRPWLVSGAAWILAFALGVWGAGIFPRGDIGA